MVVCVSAEQVSLILMVNIILFAICNLTKFEGTMEKILQESINSLLETNDLLIESHNDLRKDAPKSSRVSIKEEQSFEFLTDKVHKMKKERAYADQKVREKNLLIFGLKDNSNTGDSDG